MKGKSNHPVSDQLGEGVAGRGVDLLHEQVDPIFQPSDGIPRRGQRLAGAVAEALDQVRCFIELGPGEPGTPCNAHRLAGCQGIDGILVNGDVVALEPDGENGGLTVPPHLDEGRLLFDIGPDRSLQLLSRVDRGSASELGTSAVELGLVEERVVDGFRSGGRSQSRSVVGAGYLNHDRVAIIGDHRRVDLAVENDAGTGPGGAGRAQLDRSVGLGDGRGGDGHGDAFSGRWHRLGGRGRDGGCRGQGGVRGGYRYRPGAAGGDEKSDCDDGRSNLHGSMTTGNTAWFHSPTRTDPRSTGRDSWEAPSSV